MAHENDDNRPVTNKQLEHRLEKIPTRWEVYTLILGAVFLREAVPNISLKSGLQALVAVIS